MSATRLRVAIIGGGVGGLTAAIALHRVGIDATIYERQEEPATAVGGGLHLWHNAMRVLRNLGISSEVEAIGAAVDVGDYRTWRGARLAQWQVADVARRVGAPTIGVARKDLVPALARHVGHDRLRAGVTCTGFEQDADGVTVQFADGSEIRADALIGADGLRSVVRDRLFGEEEPRYAGYTLWHATTDVPRDVVPFGLFRVLWGPGSRFAYYHVGDGRLYWFALANAEEGGTDPLEGAKTSLLSRYEDWMSPCTEIIASTPPGTIARMDIYDRPPRPRWGEGRVALLGDAAHAMTLNNGQGACQAIEDAPALTRSLAGAGAEVAAALRAYETSRIGHASKVTRRSALVGEIGRWDNPGVVSLRNAMMRPLLAGPARRGYERDMARVL